MIPRCPPYTTKLWDGYSYLAAQASSKSHTIDLGESECSKVEFAFVLSDQEMIILNFGTSIMFLWPPHCYLSLHLVSCGEWRVQSFSCDGVKK